MAIIKCPKCNGDVSDKAKNCPHCNYQINEFETVERLKNKSNIAKNNYNPVITIICIVIICIMIMNIVLGKPFAVVRIAVIVIALFVMFFMSLGTENEKTENNINEIDKLLKDKNFETSKNIAVSLIESKKQFRIDMQNKRIAICDMYPTNKVNILKFTDIIDCEILEDNNTIMKGGVGRAIVGGALAGGVGAIVGANTRKSQNITNSLQLRIITNDISKSLYTIKLIKNETKKDSIEYKRAMNFANNVYATVMSIINDNNNEGVKKMVQNNGDFIEQLERLSKLKDSGAITQEEFEISKKKILESQNTINNEDDLENGKEHIEIENNDMYNIEDKIQLYGYDKIAIIKAVRDEAGLSLETAKKIVDEYMDKM